VEQRCFNRFEKKLFNACDQIGGKGKATKLAEPIEGTKQGARQAEGLSRSHSATPAISQSPYGLSVFSPFFFPFFPFFPSLLRFKPNSANSAFDCDVGAKRAF